MQVEDGKSYLRGPVDYLLLLEFLAFAVLDELVDIASLAVLHDNVEATLIVLECIPETNDVYVLELLK